MSLSHLADRVAWFMLAAAGAAVVAGWAYWVSVSDAALRALYL